MHTQSTHFTRVQIHFTQIFNMKKQEFYFVLNELIFSRIIINIKVQVDRFLPSCLSSQHSQMLTSSDCLSLSRLLASAFFHRPTFQSCTLCHKIKQSETRRSNLDLLIHVLTQHWPNGIVNQTTVHSTVITVWGILFVYYSTVKAFP